MQNLQDYEKILDILFEINHNTVKKESAFYKYLKNKLKNYYQLQQIQSIIKQILYINTFGQNISTQNANQGTVNSPTFALKLPLKRISALERLWIIYKLLLLFDLYEIRQIFRYSFGILYNYINSLYLSLHSWSHQQVVQLILDIKQWKYLKSEVEKILDIHFQIKQNTLKELIWDNNKQIQRLKQTEGIIRMIKLKIFLEYLRRSKQFMKKKQNSQLLMMIFQISDNQPQLKLYFQFFSEIFTMVQDIQNFNNQELVIQYYKQKLKSFKDNINGKKNSQLQIIYYIQIGIKLQYKNLAQCLQFIDFLKFQIVKVIYQESSANHKIFVCSFQQLINLQIFNEKYLQSLWKQFIEVINLRIFNIKNKFDIKNKQHTINFNDIFNKFNLILTSFIANKIEINYDSKIYNHVILFGKTKSGKSSFIKFLTKQPSISIGKNFVSETLLLNSYPLVYNNKKLLIWDTPGFNDNRTLVHRLYICLMLRMLTVNKNIEIIYMISKVDNIFQLSGYLQFVKKLGDFLNWEIQYLVSIKFIFSKIIDQQIIRQQFQANIEQFKMKRNNQYKVIDKRLKAMIKQKFNTYYKQFENLLFQKLTHKNLFFYNNNIEWNDRPIKKQNQNTQRNYNLRKEEYRLRMIKLLFQQPQFQKITIPKEILLTDSEIHFFQNFIIEDLLLNELKEQSSDLSLNFKTIFTVIRYLKQIKLDQSKEFVKCFQDIYLQEFKKSKQHFILINEKQLETTTKLRNIQKYVFSKDEDQKLKQFFTNILINYLETFFQNENFIPKNSNDRIIILQKLYDYIQALIKYIYTEHQKKKLCYVLESLENDLKGDYKFIYKHLFQISNYELKLQCLYDCIQENQLQYNVIWLIKQLTLKRLEIKVYFVMLQNLVHIRAMQIIKKMRNMNKKLKFCQSQFEFQNRYNFDNKMEILRLNYFEQGNYKVLIFSEFLQINGIFQQSRYILACTSPKIFSCQVIFDKHEYNIQCKGPFYLIANKFTFQTQICKIKLECNGQPISVIFSAEQQYPSEKLIINDQQSRKSSKLLVQLDQMINCNLDQNIKFELARKQNQQKIAYIQKKYRLISRVKMSSIYKEVFLYEPDICYNQRILIQKRRYIITEQKKAIYEQYEFGSQLLLHIILKQFKDQAWNQQQIKLLWIFCYKLVQLLIDQFKDTAIQLNEYNFNKNLVTKLAKQFRLQDIKVQQPQVQQFQFLSKYIEVTKKYVFKIIYTKVITELQTQYINIYGLSKGVKIISDELNKIKIFCDSIINQSAEYVLAVNKQNKKLIRILHMLTVKFKLQINKIYQLGSFMWIGLINVLGFTKIRTDLSIVYSQEYMKRLINSLRNRLLIKIPDLNQGISKIYQAPKNNLGSNNDKQQFQHQSEGVLIKKILNLIRECKFQKCRIQMLYVSKDLLDNRNYKHCQKLYSVLRKKYPTIYNQSIESLQIQKRQKQILKSYQKQQIQYYYTFLSKQQIQDSSIKIKQKHTYDIITFDGQRQNNGIINILMAAEIQKLTHRPIMHMFDFIAGHTTGAIIAGALTIPHYGWSQNYICPQFRAYQFIQDYSKIVELFSENFSFKYKYKSLNFKNIKNKLALLNSQKNYNSFIYGANQQNWQKMSNIYQLTCQILQDPFQISNMNPIINISTDLGMFIKNQASDKKLNILSLGNTTNFLKKQKIFNIGYFDQPGNYNRWQIQLPQLNKRKQTTYYIDQFRVWMQQKWINETNEIRRLIDRLQDKPMMI